MATKPEEKPEQKPAGKVYKLGEGSTPDDAPEVKVDKEGKATGPLPESDATRWHKALASILRTQPTKGD